MPPGTPYNSFVRPYPIRVDEFTVPRDGSLTVAALHLLSHTHSDHIIGLDAKSFASIVICSEDAKEMLLKHETYKARYLRQEEYLLERQRTFKHLQYTVQTNENGPLNIDLLRALPLNVPTTYEISHGECVTITLIDANHCPGAVMFLIQGSKGTILHTGDFRAEPILIETIRNNPFLKRYLVDQSHHETLDTIYLDTSCMLRTFTVPTKAEATNGLVELIKMYPPNVRFFINTWTWGYEDILKAISKAFGCKIHVDRYKYEIYSNLSDRVLRESLTQDADSTRFHACERFARCTHVQKTNPNVFYVNPVNISGMNWELYISQVKGEIRGNYYPRSLMVPLHRHSPLPELRDFVSLFKPKRLVPNFLHPCLMGLDWACMPLMFGRYIADDGAKRMRNEIPIYVTMEELQLEGVIEDLELSNFEGPNGTQNPSTDVTNWTNQPGDEGGNTRIGNLVTKMLPFLPGGLATLSRRLLMDSRKEHNKKSMIEIEKGQYDSSSDEESYGRTAEFLFGGHLSQPHSSEASIVFEDSKENQGAASKESSENISFESIKNPSSQAIVPPSSPDLVLSGRSQDDDDKWLLKDVNNMLEDWSPHRLASSVISSIDAKIKAEFTQASSRKQADAGTTSFPTSLTQQTQCHIRSSSPIASEISTPASSLSIEPYGFNSRLSLSEIGSDNGTNSSLIQRYKGKEERQLKRKTIAQKLRLARPDLAARKVKSQIRYQDQRKESRSEVGSRDIPCFNKENDEIPLNWERIRLLEKNIQEDLKAGREPRLPALKCLLES